MQTDDRTINIYTLNVTLWQGHESACRAMLDEDERARALRFASPRDAARFVFGRALVRMLVSGVLGISPRDIRFAYGPKGKPVVNAPHNAPEFNLAHCADLVFAAASAHLPVGIDVEQRRTNIEHEDLALRFFSTFENACLASLPEKDRLDAFFRFWTRKEAYLKACGSGISVPLREVDTSSVPARNGKIQVRAGRVGADAEAWQIKDIDAPEGYFAAVASTGRLWSTRQRELTPDDFNPKNETLALP